MAKKVESEWMNKIVLFVVCLFLGWFGVDKLYVGGTKEWKLALIKFLSMFILVGVIWNIYDMVCVFTNKYKLNPLK